METLCTVIAHPKSGKPEETWALQCVPLRQALEMADQAHEYTPGKYSTVRVYAETNNGATLTLIYQPEYTSP